MAKRNDLEGLRNMFHIFYCTYLKNSRKISLLSGVLLSVLLQRLKINLSQFTARKQAKMGHFHMTDGLILFLIDLKEVTQDSLARGR